MKPKSTLRSFLCIAGSSLLTITYASATPYYWDANDGVAGFQDQTLPLLPTAGTWAAPTAGTATAGWSTDSDGLTAINGNSVTTTTADDLFFGTSTKPYNGAITISGTVAAKSIYECSTRGSNIAVTGATPTITFGDIGTFETGRDATVTLPAFNLAGANTGDANTSGMIWRSIRTVSIQALVSNNAAKNTLQTSPGSPFSYPGRVAVNSAGDLGAIGTPLVFDGGSLRMNSGFNTYLETSGGSYSLSGLNTKHPVTITLNKNLGIDNSVSSSTTFTIDTAINLGSGYYFADGSGITKLTQNNTWAGTYSISGTLEVSSSLQLGAETSPFQFGSGDQSGGSGTLKITGTTMTSLGARTLNFTEGKAVGFNIDDANNNFTLDKVLTQGGPAGGFNKLGAGTLTLTENNSYGGTTTVGGGTLKVGHANALGRGIMTSAVIGTTVSTGFTLDLNGITNTNEVISLNGTGIGANGALINSSVTPVSLGTGIAGATVAATGSGSGFTAAPVVAISGTGSGAAATASLGLTTASFTVNVSGDMTYSANPTVTITGGGGIGATATPVMTAGKVTGLTITAAGYGYTSAPTVTVSGGTGTTGSTITTFTGNATNFCVGGLAITVAGSGYTGTPTFTFDGNPATVTPALTSVNLTTNSSIGGAGDITINGVVSETGTLKTLTKVGVGTLTLSGSSTYTGATAIQGGTLIAGSNAPSAAAGAFGNNATEISLGVAGGNNNASLLIGGAFTVGRVVRLATSNTSDAGTRVLTIGGNTEHNSEFSGNIFLGTASQAGRGLTLTAANGGQVTFSGVIQNPGSMDATTYTVTKAGLGTVVLSNTNTYTGATAINDGTLLVNGSLAAASAVSVTAGTLGGTGSISGAVTIGNSTGAADSILAPGTSIGAIATGNLAFNSDGQYACELNGTSVTSDRANVTGTVAIDAAATLAVSLTGSLSGGQKYFIVVNDDVGPDAVTGTFAGLAQDAVVGNFGGTDLKISYTGDFGTSAISGGNDIVLYTNVAGSPYDTWAISKGLTGLAGSSTDPAKTADPDKDGRNNLGEFAFNGNPLSGSDNGKIAGLVQDASSPVGNEMTLVVAVRDGTTFANAGSPVVQTATKDGVVYTIEGTLDLVTIPGSAVSYIGGPSNTAPLATGLPDLTGTDWEYHTFKLDASEGLGSMGFLRAKAE